MGNNQNILFQRNRRCAVSNKFTAGCTKTKDLIHQRLCLGCEYWETSLLANVTLSVLHLSNHQSLRPTSLGFPPSFSLCYFNLILTKAISTKVVGLQLKLVLYCSICIGSAWENSILDEKKKLKIKF